MADIRRLGHAQRRRVGGPSNIYDAVMKPPSFGVRDQVRATGRYGPVTVTGIVPNYAKPEGGNDGHAYIVTGGKSGKQSLHLSGELRPFELGMEEAT